MNNSKESLEHICKTCDNKGCPYIHYEKSRCVWYGIVKQDLDKSEKIEKENQVLREKLKIIYEHKLLNPYKNPKLRVLYKLTDEQYEFIKEVLSNER